MVDHKRIDEIDTARRLQLEEEQKLQREKHEREQLLQTKKNELQTVGHVTLQCTQQVHGIERGLLQIEREIENMEQSDVQPMERLIHAKKKELERLNVRLGDLQADVQRHKASVESKNEELKRILQAETNSKKQEESLRDEIKDLEGQL